LSDVFDSAVRAGAGVTQLEIGPTRDLTTPQDLVRENVGYLQ
jgi:hypothetical protein